MIINQLTEQLLSLRDLLYLIDNQQYTQKIRFLNDSSIGAHSRHIIELIQCLIKGYSTSNVDYINRERDFKIEQNRELAIQEIENIALALMLADKEMELITENNNTQSVCPVRSTYFREIEYNKEHTIHHLALIRVALREMELDIVSESFGVAHATLKYLSQQKKQPA